MPVPSDLDQLIHVDLGIRVHELLPQRIIEGHGVQGLPPVLLLETISHIEIGIDRVGIKPGVIGVVVIAQLPPFPGPRRVVQVVDDAVVLGFADFLSEADDADRAVPVGDVLCRILTRPLDLFDGEVARVDPVDSEPFCAGAEAGSDSIVGHVDASHQHGTILLGQRVDDLATLELQSAAVLAVTPAQDLNVAAIGVHRHESTEREKPVCGVFDESVYLTGQALVGDPVAVRESIRLAGGTQSGPRPRILAETQRIHHRPLTVGGCNVRDTLPVRRETQVGHALARPERRRRVE